jgi:DNA-binding transcriptional regulator YhcF (GntR family)
MNMLFRVRRTGTASVHNQIREHLVSAILNGSLLPGQRMPSTRELATSLHVARNTVVQVYERLVADGYLQVRDRAGYFVNREVKSGWVSSREANAHASSQRSVWTRKLKFYPSRQPYIRTLSIHILIRIPLSMDKPTRRSFRFPSGANVPASRSRAPSCSSGPATRSIRTTQHWWSKFARSSCHVAASWRRPMRC